MKPPDVPISGPVPIEPGDVPALNELFSDAFTERYRRDGLAGVRVPPLNPKIWSYAVDDAGAGAMLWRDDDGAVAAFNIAHCSGTEGWMGPLAVRPDLQGVGLGRRIVNAATAYLRERGVTTLGLETMPRTVENIGFYSRLGFVPGALTVTLGRDVPSGPMPAGVELLSGLAEGPHAARVDGIRRRLHEATGGHDFGREIALTADLALGDTAVCVRDGAVVGFALWHAEPLTNGNRADEVRLLKLYADDLDVFGTLIDALERAAARRKVGRVAVRCQGRFTDAYRLLIRRGYQVRWTDLRMTLAGFEEPALPSGAVLFSNWEI